MTVGIIGGGASGMMAALAAAEQGAQVLLLERQARVGRKLLATGNGRCNLSNLTFSLAAYHGLAPEFARPALDAFGPERTLAYFRSLGLLTVAEPSGRVYPYSDQAASVVDVLRFALDAAGVEVMCGCEVRRVRQGENGFILRTDAGDFRCERLIVACGGLAGTKLGGSMSGYQILRSLGHGCTPLLPALVQLCSDFPMTASLKGIRAQAGICILRDSDCFARGGGEVQFTEYGLSGPGIFALSRGVCALPGEWSCVLDLLPQLSEGELLSLLYSRRERAPELEANDLFTGLIHNRLGRVLVQSAGCRLNRPLHTLSREELTELCAAAKAFSMHLIRTQGMDCAQVTAGGIRTDEFDPGTLESRIHAGLYACGEVLDIDGDCGGYNLQWAWSSGHAAGCAAGRRSV